jgi:hypothetical protein
VEKIRRAKKKHDLGLQILEFVVQAKIRTGGFREQGAEKDICLQKADSNRRVEKLHNEALHNF